MIRVTSPGPLKARLRLLHKSSPTLPENKPCSQSQQMNFYFFFCISLILFQVYQIHGKCKNHLMGTIDGQVFFPGTTNASILVSACSVSMNLDGFKILRPKTLRFRWIFPGS
ncbi:hypothetical protein M758_12G181600 [Ceratodon purpureus]|uniref:Uncharacterized protein n=1 Tax=Ceratodon purpureus TaxID=3225 RepID=A0A8T0G912_CERPU|nr:hypothetical protein KC19_12G177900 [Ceratodon purpureus]KAG0599831.1 hypothetical protein M758_12G181600 [Ceratodon purpureus]